MISASALPLLIDCAAPANPNTWLAKDSSNAAMRAGNAVHKLAEWQLTGKDIDVAKACLLEGVSVDDEGRVARLWGNLFVYLAGARGSAEVAYAYAPETGIGRVLGFGIGREYEKHGLRTDEIAGTADLVLSGRGSMVTVYDVKTGQAPAESYRWQLRALGLAAARHCHTAAATIGVIKVSEVEVDDSWREELDESDLDDIASEVLRVFREAPTAKPRAGSHCAQHYCRARNKCPAFRAWRAA